MAPEHKAISVKSIRVLQCIAMRHTYDQILSENPDLTHQDIYSAASEVLAALAKLSMPPTHYREIRAEHPRAYLPWSQDEDSDLRGSFSQGSSIKELAAKLQRKEGAIKSRLVKLGLINTDGEITQKEPDDVNER